MFRGTPSILFGVPSRSALYSLMQYAFFFQALIKVSPVLQMNRIFRCIVIVY